MALALMAGIRIKGVFMKITFVILASLISTSAFAEFEKHEPAKIDFNKMIEANHMEAEQMKQALSDQGFGQRPKTSIKGKKRVTDFLDAELGWGEAPKVVDRRFNSVAEPKVRLIPKS